MKDVVWVGSSRADLAAFPTEAKGNMGYQIHLIQTGRDPDDWKPLKDLGKGISGVYEIRLSISGDIFRTAYVAKLADKIVILHCWQKKTEGTAKKDKDLIVNRYRQARDNLNEI